MSSERARMLRPVRVWLMIRSRMTRQTIAAIDDEELRVRDARPEEFKAASVRMKIRGTPRFAGTEQEALLEHVGDEEGGTDRADQDTTDGPRLACAAAGKRIARAMQPRQRPRRVHRRAGAREDRRR